MVPPGTGGSAAARAASNKGIPPTDAPAASANANANVNVNANVANVNVNANVQSAL
jgi:hypothetical protein